MGAELAMRLVIKRDGYYRIVINGNGVNASQSLIQPGDPAGWDTDSTWQTLVTLRWSIATPLRSLHHRTGPPGGRILSQLAMHPERREPFSIIGSLTKPNSPGLSASFIISLQW